MRAAGSLRRALGLLALAQHVAASRCPQSLEWAFGLCNMDAIVEESTALSE